MRRARRTAALLVTLAAVASARLVVAAEADAVARGAYIAAAAGCDLCHTDSANGGTAYAGGRRMSTQYGVITTPNITPDHTTGIGAWTAADFARAMRWGIAPDDTHYLPVFPYPFYNGFGERDLADLKAFLDSLPAVSRPNVAAADTPAPWPRSVAAVGIAATPHAGPWKADPSKSPAWNRGAYLVTTVGRCGDCHTPRTALGAPDPDRLLGGNAAGEGKKAPNITADPDTGIGKWSEDDIVTLLKEGQTPEPDFVGGSMAEIVKSTSRLTDADRAAIAVYLKTVPAKRLDKKS